MTETYCLIVRKSNGMIGHLNVPMDIAPDEVTNIDDKDVVGEHPDLAQALQAVGYEPFNIHESANN